jgi:hypothetical protein
MKFKKLALITAFGLLSTSVAADPPSSSASDEVVITGTITELLSVVVAPNETITMDNVANPITVNVEANVQFRIKVKSDNDLKLDHTTASAEVDYTFDLKDGSGDSITDEDNDWSGTQDPIDTTSASTDSWDLEVTTTGVDGSTLAGVYTDTLTLTIEAI